MTLVLGGDQVVEIPREIADKFAAGDAILPIVSTGEILHVPAAERRIAKETVDRASAAFSKMGAVTDEQISKFFEEFAARLDDDAIWSEIQKVNGGDVAAARNRGRSTTRLVADEKLRRGMIEGLRGWIGATSRRGTVVETIEHDGWRVDLVGAELGIVAFVFEGRPNVLADATGVLRGGNAVVFRIGRDALGTARAIMKLALDPALDAAGLPEGAVCLIDSPAHAAGWALFSDARISLAVARGSGSAVATLGGLARQAGIAASLHGTGGAWIVASPNGDEAAFQAAVLNSMDRKVCNTLNVCCIPRERAADLVPLLLQSLAAAGENRGQAYKLHVADGDQSYVPAHLFKTQIAVRRAEGDVNEPQAELLPEADLGVEWEWEETPEVSLKIVDGIDHAVALFNRYSPQFIASLVSRDTKEHEAFYGAVNAPFVGNGFTRWVDGQYALERPELGLSSWQNGRLFGRGGVLSGDSVYTVRGRVTQSDPDVGR
ncbi:MAG: aldehyde dehydrogenase family protein [Candidatus Binatia bacterium]|nr:aldehyde dehydrogenase family protein [Candidatus Binatia bacterium]